MVEIGLRTPLAECCWIEEHDPVKLAKHISEKFETSFKHASRCIINSVRWGDLGLDDADTLTVGRYGEGEDATVAQMERLFVILKEHF